VLLDNLSEIGFPKCKLVLDRGCYSKDNVNKLFTNEVDFLMGTKTSLKYIKTIIESNDEKKTCIDNYNGIYKQYGYRVPIDWTYQQLCSTTQNAIIHKKKVYVYVYYNPEKAFSEEERLAQKLFKLREELLLNKRVKENENNYKKYFDIVEADGKVVDVKSKASVIDKLKRLHGYHVILSNTKLDMWEALCKYRAKDVAEKTFENVKERLNFRRALVSSERNLDGKLFVAFVGLVLQSYISKQMKKTNMYKDYTLQDVLDELSDIECFEYENGVIKISEILEKPKRIYMNMDVNLP
jgi:transposase